MTIEYLLSDKALTEAELANSSFTAYTAPFGINPDNEYIIYVRLTDKTGNTDYICSDGIVLDGTSPVINGIENGKTYCEAQTVTIDEKYVDTVTINRTVVTLDENNSFVLSPADDEQKIIVTDKAGNTAEMTVTVNDGHTYEWQSGNGKYWQKCKFCGNETTKKLIPEIVISGADRVCRTQDYAFNLKLPEGGKLITTGYEFEKIGGDQDHRGQYRVLVLRRLWQVFQRQGRYKGNQKSRHRNDEAEGRFQISTDRRFQQFCFVACLAVYQRRCCHWYNGCKQEEKVQQIIE